MKANEKKIEINYEAKSALEQILKGYVVDKVNEDLTKEGEKIQNNIKEDLEEIKEKVKTQPSDLRVNQIVEKQINKTEENIKEEFEKQKNDVTGLAKELAGGMQKLHNDSDKKLVGLDNKIVAMQDQLQKDLENQIKITGENISGGIELIIEGNEKSYNKINDSMIEINQKEKEAKERLLEKLEEQGKLLKVTLGIGIVNIIGIISIIMCNVMGLL